jgi:hypothetical protein
LFQRNRLTVFERVTKNNVHETSMLHSNETPVLEYEGWDRTTSEMRVSLPGFGSGDSRRSENACKHTYEALKT